MRLSKVMLLCCWSLLAVTANAQSRSGRCQVTMTWWSLQEKIGSGVIQLGIFDPLVADGTTFKTFKSDGNAIVTVGVNFDTAYETARFREVRLMVAASDKEAEHVFDLVGNSQASTAFRRYWNLTVSKGIVVGDMKYKFELKCWDNVKFPR